MREPDFTVALMEWPDGRAVGGPRVLGMADDPALVRRVRRHIAEQRRQELRNLEGGPARECPALVAVSADPGEGPQS